MIGSKNSTVLIGEEFPLVREGLSHLCRHLGFDVVSRCGDGNAALAAIQRYKPAVAVLDQNLPELSASDISRRLRSSTTRVCPTRILILSDRNDRRSVLDSLRNGVAGYLLKSAEPQDFARAIRSLIKGQLYLSPGLNIGAVIESSTPSAPSDPVGQLSAREYQVFKFLIDGIRAKEIASRLDISPKTIDTYRANLMRKLDIHDVAGLVKFAIQRELTSV